jgi:hypothetical protein
MGMSPATGYTAASWAYPQQETTGGISEMFSTVMLPMMMMMMMMSMMTPMMKSMAGATR